MLTLSFWEQVLSLCATDSPLNLICTSYSWVLLAYYFRGGVALLCIHAQTDCLSNSNPFYWFVTSQSCVQFSWGNTAVTRLWMVVVYYEKSKLVQPIQDAGEFFFFFFKLWSLHNWIQMNVNTFPFTLIESCLDACPSPLNTALWRMLCTPLVLVTWCLDAGWVGEITYCVWKLACF